jgi:hypothetical protein
MRRATARLATTGRSFLLSRTSRGLASSLAPPRPPPRRVRQYLDRVSERLLRSPKPTAATTPTPMPSDVVVDARRALDLLGSELAAIRAAGLPSWLETLSDPTPARWIAAPRTSSRDASSSSSSSSSSESGVASEPGVILNPTPEDGPWHVLARVKGEDGGGYDAAFYDVRLTFTRAHPREPPDVHVLSVVVHALVDASTKEVAGVFYHPDNFPPKRVERVRDPSTGEDVVSGATYDVKGTLACVRRFLSAPPKLPGPADVATERQRAWVLETWTRDAAANAERERVIAAYRDGGGGCRGMACEALFDADAGWRESWFHPELRAAFGGGVESGGELSVDAAKALCREEAPGVFSFPLFSTEYAELLVAEIERFETSGLPVRRPNSMNRYGVVVNEIGLERMIDSLQTRVLSPISEALFPSQGGGCLDGHHSFIVRYKQGEDLGLDMHTDDSDVTFNVCLGKEGFTAAGLTFCGVLGGESHRKLSLVCKQVVGRCVVHLGAHRHGADDIGMGERLNLIVWNHSSLYRSTDAYRYRDVPEETSPPSPECLSYTHDKDYGKYKTYPPGAETFARTAWYPPTAEAVKMK